MTWARTMAGRRTDARLDLWCSMWEFCKGRQVTVTGPFEGLSETCCFLTARYRSKVISPEILSSPDMMMDRWIVSPDTTLTLSSTCHWALNVKDTAYYYTWPSPLPFMDRATTRMSSDRVAMRPIVNRMTDTRLGKRYLPLRSVITSHTFCTQHHRCQLNTEKHQCHWCSLSYTIRKHSYWCNNTLLRKCLYLYQ